MSDHSIAYLPAESWCYASPDIAYEKRSVDVGLLAESLLYYDGVYFSLSTESQYAELLEWLLSQPCERAVFGLIEEGILRTFHYCFATVPIQDRDGSYQIWNMQDERQHAPRYLEHFFSHPEISRNSVSSDRGKRLVESLLKNAAEVKSDLYGQAIENARKDVQNPKHCAVIVQSLLDEVWPMLELGETPLVRTKVIRRGSKTDITFNVDSEIFLGSPFFERLSRILGKELKFHNGTPLAAIGEANKIIQTAMNLNCDLFLPRPISQLIGDKIEESIKITKSQENLQNFKEKIEFPNIRALVNSGVLDLSDVLELRRKAKKFRRWLQNEADRDRDALIAYHHEIAEEAGLVKWGRSVLPVFGVVGGAVGAAATMSATGGFAGIVLSGVAGAAPSFLAQIGANYGKDWRPVVFGNWMKREIDRKVRRSRR